MNGLEGWSMRPAIVLVDAKPLASANHLLHLCLNEYYGVGLVRSSQPQHDPLDLFGDDVGGTLIYLYDGNQKAVKSFFTQDKVAQLGLHKVLAIDTSVKWAEISGDLGQDSVLFYDDQFQGDELNVAFRQIIGVPENAEPICPLVGPSPFVVEKPDGFRPNISYLVRSTDDDRRTASFDRMSYPKLTIGQHLLRSETNEIRRHFAGEIRMTEDELAGIALHLQNCKDDVCNNALCKELSGVCRTELLELVLQEDSIHTSNPPLRKLFADPAIGNGELALTPLNKFRIRESRGKECVPLDEATEIPSAPYWATE